MNDKTTHFGFKEVATEAKEGMVGKVFTSVARAFIAYGKDILLPPAEFTQVIWY